MNMDKKIARIAKNDAYDWAMAGLISNDIAWKNERISGYGEAFNKALNNLDLKMEEKFLGKERIRLEKKGFTGEIVSKKGRNIKIALLVIGGLYVAREMGLFETAKQKQRKAKLFLATIQNPESEEYKDLVEKISKKVAAAIDGGDSSGFERWKAGQEKSKYEKPLPQPGQELPPEAGGDADDFWPHPN